MATDRACEFGGSHHTSLVQDNQDGDSVFPLQETDNHWAAKGRDATPRIHLARRESRVPPTCPSQSASRVHNAFLRDTGSEPILNYRWRQNREVRGQRSSRFSPVQSPRTRSRWR